jgi:hypothetical protein
LLGNPGFETGTAAPWTATSSASSNRIINDSSTEPPHGGSWDAWLDGHGTATTDTPSQTVTLPTGCSTYQLSYWLHIDTAETTTSKAYDTMSVEILNGSGNVLGTVASYSNLSYNTGYTSFVVDDTAINVS